ncbi:NAD(P)H-binding protein [Limosilactobacillus ingluviei]|uniref:NAD(P)H-binding protein n=1 Tax=Limosilactobacillus ingluviei TaxID=148604 RepID=UPI0023F04EB3|nr:NAD(P)H-binding protein [Limosilactobacillus ingluviei]
MKYGITAATGHFGQAAVAALNELVGADQVVVIARNVAKAQQLFPVNEVRHGDYGEPASLAPALAGLDRVLFISSQPAGGAVSREVQHQNLVAALAAARVDRVVYTSFPHADQAQSWLAADHQLTEQALRAAGVPAVMVRNNWYLENEASFLQAVANGQPAAYWARQPLGWALEKEYAAGAAKVLTLADPKPVYEFAGPITSYSELGAAAAQASGQSNSATQVSQAQYIAGLEQAGLDHATAALYASFQAPADQGDLKHASDDLPTVLGHALTPLPVAIQAVLAE